MIRTAEDIFWEQQWNRNHFRAYFMDEDGDEEVYVFPNTLSFSRVFKIFKSIGQDFEQNGRLYCKGILVRETGDWPEPN